MNEELQKGIQLFCRKEHIWGLCNEKGKFCFEDLEIERYTQGLKIHSKYHFRLANKL